MTISTHSPFPHGIDITAPGGIDQLLEFHRARFGDAQMNANSGGDESGGDGGDGESGSAGGTGGDGSQDEQGDQDKGLKSALAAEREASKKAKADLAAAQARVQELEDATKSAEQREQEAQERTKADLTEATSKLDKAEQLIARYEVASEKGLDLKAAKRLQGSTREEIESDADDLIALLGGAQQSDDRRGDPGQGARKGAKESTFEQGRQRASARFAAQQQ